MDDLNCEENKVIICNDVAQIMSEICGIARGWREFLTEKRASFSSKSRKKNIYLGKFEQRSLSRSILSHFSQTIIVPPACNLKTRLWQKSFHASFANVFSL